jgi:hypothetical protein
MATTKQTGYKNKNQSETTSIPPIMIEMKAAKSRHTK